MNSTTINPYQVLGVERSATQDEVKSAYRKLALKYHPDRNPGDKQAEERFKEVSEAYATLRDPDSRSRFDRYGNAGGRPDFETVDWQTIFREADINVNWDPHRGMPKTGNAVFDMLFGAVTGMMRNSGLLPGEHRDISLDLAVPLARSGGSVRVRVPGPSICPTCKGSGRSGGAICPSCGGRGIQRGGSLVDVQVPQGMKPGTKLRLKGLGGPGTPPGDVFVTLGVNLPEGVTRRGGDLLTEMFLTAWELDRGVTSEVLGMPVQIPRGTRDGATLRYTSGGLGGDLLLTVREDLWRGLRRIGKDWMQQLTRGGLPLAAKE